LSDLATARICTLLSARKRSNSIMDFRFSKYT